MQRRQCLSAARKRRIRPVPSRMVSLVLIYVFHVLSEGGGKSDGCGYSTTEQEQGKTVF
jgi:hypothetical protein